MTTDQPADTDQMSVTPIPAPAASGGGWRSVTVPTDGMPGFARSVYNTMPGKVLYMVTSDAALFLRVGVMAAATLGLLYTIFHVWSLRAGAPSVIWAAFFFDLLITLLATGILYALRTVVEELQRQRG